MPEGQNFNQSKYKYISLSLASSSCKYSQEYLSLRARQGKLKAVKLGRNWVTTKEWLIEYLRYAEEKNNNLKLHDKKEIEKIKSISPKPLFSFKNYFSNLILFFGQILSQFNLTPRKIFVIALIVLSISISPVLAERKNDVFSFGNRIYGGVIYYFNEGLFYISDQSVQLSNKFSKLFFDFGKSFSDFNEFIFNEFIFISESVNELISESVSGGISTIESILSSSILSSSKSAINRMIENSRNAIAIFGNEVFYNLKNLSFVVSDSLTSVSDIIGDSLIGAADIVDNLLASISDGVNNSISNVSDAVGVSLASVSEFTEEINQKNEQFKQQFKSGVRNIAGSIKKITSKECRDHTSR